MTEKQRKPITEEMGVHKEWYERSNSKDFTLEQLPEFMRELSEDYQHDYGTICHAIAASGVAAMRAFDRGPMGGITGFQAGCIMWEVIREWGVFGDGPLSMRDWSHLLYPQYESDFTSIPHAIWERVVEKAKAFVVSKETSKMHPEVAAHIVMVASGKPPFGLKVSAPRGGDE